MDSKMKTTWIINLIVTDRRRVDSYSQFDKVMTKLFIICWCKMPNSTHEFRLRESIPRTNCYAQTKSYITYLFLSHLSFYTHRHQPRMKLKEINQLTLGIVDFIFDRKNFYVVRIIARFSCFCYCCCLQLVFFLCCCYCFLEIWTQQLKKKLELFTFGMRNADRLDYTKQQ